MGQGVCGTYREFVIAIRGTCQLGQIDFLSLFVTPYILDQFGVFDERIPVVLNIRNGIQAVHFFFAYRVFAVPCQQHFDQIGREAKIGIVVDVFAVVAYPRHILVRGSGIEICPREIAFVVIANIKSEIIPSGVFSHEEDSVIHFRGINQNTRRIVGFVAVGQVVSRIEQVQVAVCTETAAFTSPPTLGQTMLDVHAGCTTSLNGQIAFDIGIHIPYRSV